MEHDPDANHRRFYLLLAGDRHVGRRDVDDIAPAGPGPA